MKKLLLGLALVATTTGISASDEIYSCVFNKENNEKGISSYTSEWKNVTDGTEFLLTNWNNNNSSWAYVKCGSKNNASVATIVNAEAWTEAAIDQVTINASGTKASINSIKLYVLDSNDANAEPVATYEIDKNNLTTKAADYSVNIANPATGMFYKLEVDCQKGSSNGLLQLNSIKYYGTTSGSVLQTPEVSFGITEYTVTFGEEFDAPAVQTNSDGDVLYTSSDETVATVNSDTGAVEIIGTGTTVIKAVVAASETFRAGEASYTLTVLPAGVIFTSSLGEKFDFVQLSGDTMPWKLDSKYGLKGSAYVNSTNKPCEAIAASEMIDLTGFENIMLNFENAVNQYKVNNVLIANTAELAPFCQLAIKAEDATEWTVLDYQISFPASQSWTFYANTPVDLSAYNNGKYQFGFKYTSTEATAGTWEIKNIMLTGNKTSRVSEVEDATNAAPVYFNLQGVRVANPVSGLYIVVEGNKSRKVVF
ncbi:MAG: hypothetical protein K2M87_02650 [Muribaculaceae bacterium]|nr:hypothetical protein [Muribaculaceae bacterium]